MNESFSTDFTNSLEFIMIIHSSYRNTHFTIRMATSLTVMFRSFGVDIIWIPSSEEININLDPIFANKVRPRS